MACNSVRYVALLLALAAIGSAAVTAAEEAIVPVKGAAAETKPAEPAQVDDESDDERAAEDQVGFNTLEDMLLFRGPLATLWAAPQSVAAAVEWREVTPKSDPPDDEPKE